ncbi:hypothetical protein V8E53_015044 [Lactarius tabidus]
MVSPTMLNVRRLLATVLLASSDDLIEGNHKHNRNRESFIQGAFQTNYDHVNDTERKPCSNKDANFPCSDIPSQLRLPRTSRNSGFRDDS